MNQTFKYIAYIFKRNKNTLIFAAIFVAAIQFFMVQFMSNIDMEPMRKMMESFPPAIKGMIGKDMLNKLTVEGSAAFAFTHPITLGILSYLSLSIPMKEITQSIETGELEMMLSYPITRKKLLSSIWISGIIMLGIVSLLAILSSVLALYLYHDSGVEVYFKMAIIGINMFFLFLFIFSYTLLISVYSKDASKSTTIAVAITATAYLVMVLSEIWNKISWTKQINFFNYFNTNEVLNGSNTYLLHISILFIFSIAIYFISVAGFNNRDV